MELKQHILDTLKEWQMKIGFNKEKVKLYYPISSLYVYLNLDKNCKKENLKKILSQYVKEELSCLGRINIIWEIDRVCIEISEDGGKYVNENIDEPYLLKEFLLLLNDKSKTISDVEKLFNNYANRYGGHCYIEENDDNEGKIFYFSDSVPEDYVYCIEDDEFGITYHRFSREDYNK